MIGRIHEPSGVEHRLLTANIPFDQYVNAARTLISKYRVDLDSEHANTIIEANSPFEWRPYNSDHFKRGILLIHGLYDSPFSVRDIGAHFLKQGYLVRAVLLPGHGTIPGDLLTIHRQDWLDTVANAITSTSAMVDDFYLGGFSLGAALCLIESHRAANLRALLLMAPGLKPRHRKAHLLKIIRLFTWISQKAKWYQISNQTNYTKYNSHSYNPSYQASELMKLASKIQAKVPLFIVASEDDETIDTEFVLRYFKEQTNPLNQMILYTKHPNVTTDTDNLYHIEKRSSVYPEQNIIDFSHSCIPVSPSNPYLGENGKLLDFSHYHLEHNKQSEDKEIRIGAITANNLMHYTMQRLSYNPDFDTMAQRFTDFIENLNP